MASTYDSMFQDGNWPAHTEAFGETVTYTPHGGSASSVTAVWEPGQEADEYDEGGQRAVKRGRLTLAPDAIAAWTPDLRDKATIGGTVYAVEQVLQLLPVVELSLVSHDRRRVGGTRTWKER